MPLSDNYPYRTEAQRLLHELIQLEKSFHISKKTYAMLFYLKDIYYLCER